MRGIGRAIVTSLSEAGAALAIGDPNFDGASELAEELSRRFGNPVVGLKLDVTDIDSFGAFLDSAREKLGFVDALVNNAGIMWCGPFEDEPAATALRQLEVNFLGLQHGIKLAIPAMRSAHKGHIVLIHSASAVLAIPGEATYSATKFAGLGYARAVREELRGSGISISVIMPGVVDTELAVGTGTGATRILTPLEVARVVVDVVSKPRPEVYIPRKIGLLARAGALLPTSSRDALFRKLIPNQLAALADPSIRSDYERRTGLGTRSEE